MLRVRWATLLFSFGVWAPLWAATQATFYVAPAPVGNDANPGTEGAPFATVGKARDVVRNYLASQSITGNVVIYLRGGVYELDEPLTLTVQDSGKNQNYVVYSSYPGEVAQLSGGKRLTTGSWALDAGSVYRTTVPAGTDFRQLYVDERRATRARKPNAGEYLSFPTEKQADGFNIPLGTLDGVTNPADKVEFAVPIEWMHKRLRIASASPSGGYTRAVINPIEWDDVNNQPQAKRDYNGRQYWLENAREFLDSPGEFYLNTSTNTLYYRPWPGQDMATAEVVRPVHESLFILKGSFAAPVHHIKFENLMLTHTGWTRPNKYGFVDVQANSLIPSPPNDNKDTQYRHDQRKDRIPAAIHATTADNIVIRGNRFARLGGTAVLFTMGGNDNQVVGNTIVDVSGGGVEFGNDAYKPVDTRMFPRRNAVQNNFLARIGQEYFGSVGILGYYTDHQVLQNNELNCLPYTGISQGWGWGSPDPADSQDNRIENNLIRTYGNRLRDGGGIYTTGSQPDSFITGNYLADMNAAVSGNIGGALYPDEGTKYFDIGSNVVNGAARWLHLWTTSIQHNNVHDTYSSTAAMLNAGSNNTVAPATVVTDGNWPQAALNIMANAGIQAPFVSAKNAPVPADVVIDDTDLCAAQLSGTWYWSGGLSGKYGSGYWYAPTTNGAATATARWRAVLPQDGVYKVFAWYASNADRATAAPFKVVFNGGSSTVTRDQRNGNGWVLLGSWPFRAGADGYVEVSNNSPGTYVEADAVRFVGDTIVGSGSYRAVVQSGVWATAASVSNPYAASFRYAAAAATETATFRWTPLLPMAGNYKVYVWSSGQPNFATNATYTLRGAGSPQSVSVNQTINGNGWVLLGTQFFNAGSSGHVELSNRANGTYVGADAMRFELQ